ncbi:MAG: PD40 domain-containing protein [Myxococcales bacterium]|nr:PD40 domain-containing protein [Myxococcales bacterium]
MRAALVFAVVLSGVYLGCSFPDPNGEPLGCGRCDLPKRSIDGDAGQADVERTATDPSAPDAGKPPVKCSPATPFGPAKLVPGIDPNIHASSPHLTADELVVFFTGQDPAASSQIMRASRVSRDQPFGPVEPVSGVNSTSNDNDPTVSSDGLTLVFHSGRSGNNDVWWAKRAGLGADFGAPTLAPGIATSAYEGQGFFHVASDELWFVSNRDGNYDIFRAKLAGGTFGAVENVTELNTPNDELLPFLSKDGLTIYFSSTREGGRGGQDLFLATRANPNGTFGAPTPIDELNTSVTEQAGSLSPDDCRIYFSRFGGPGGQQLFVAERPLPP